MRQARIERITPQPVRVESGSGSLTFVFAALPRTPALVVFHMQMQEVGLQRVHLQLDAVPGVEFVQFIYP